MEAKLTAAVRLHHDNDFEFLLRRATSTPIPHCYRNSVPSNTPGRYLTITNNLIKIQFSFPKRHPETRLRPVVEARMAVSKLLGLGLRQALESVITLASRTQTVLTRTVEDTENGKEEDDELAREVDGMSVVIFGPVRGDVGPARKLSGLSQILRSKRRKKPTLRRYHQWYPS